jgi:hypothetical protein
MFLTAGIGIATPAELTVPMKTQHSVTNTRSTATPAQDESIKSATAQQSSKRKDGGT